MQALDVYSNLLAPLMRAASMVCMLIKVLFLNELDPCLIR